MIETTITLTRDSSTRSEWRRTPKMESAIATETPEVGAKAIMKRAAPMLEARISDLENGALNASCPSFGAAGSID
jgi:hypothetical protein